MAHMVIRGFFQLTFRICRWDIKKSWDDRQELQQNFRIMLAYLNAAILNCAEIKVHILGLMKIHADHFHVISLGNLLFKSKKPHLKLR